MKKIVAGLIALTLISTSAAYAAGGKKKTKKNKAKQECCQTTSCSEKPNCCKLSCNNEGASAVKQ